MSVFIKVHKSYRTVVAVCDKDLIGKKFEEGIKQLELRETFFKGHEYSKDEAIKIIKMQLIEDATFNIVGKEAISLAIEAEAISEDSVSYVKDIPFALKLL